MFSFLPSLDEEKKSLQVPFISSRPLNRIEEIAFGPKKIQSTYRRQVQGRCTLQQACKVGLCLFKTTSQVVKIAPFGQGVFSKCAMFAQKTFALVKMSFILSYSGVILMSDNQDTINRGSNAILYCQRQNEISVNLTETRQKSLQNNCGPIQSMLEQAFIAIPFVRPKWLQKNKTTTSYSGQLLTMVDRSKT